MSLSLPLAVAVHLPLTISDKCLAGYINVSLIETAITIACARRVRLWASPGKEILQQGSASGSKSSAQSAGVRHCFARCQLLWQGTRVMLDATRELDRGCISLES